MRSRRTVVFVAILAGLLWWFWGRTFEPVEVIRAQLEAINQRDTALAYSYLAPSTREKLSLQEFQQEVQAHPQLLSTYDSVFLWRKIGTDTAKIEGTLESGDLQQVRASYVMVKQGKKWHIQAFRWQDAPPPKTP
jgi:hypothetical protein